MSLLISSLYSQRDASVASRHDYQIWHWVPTRTFSVTPTTLIASHIGSIGHTEGV